MTKRAPPPGTPGADALSHLPLPAIYFTSMASPAEVTAGVVEVPANT